MEESGIDGGMVAASYEALKAVARFLKAFVGVDAAYK